MSTRKHWRGPPRWPSAPGPDPSTPIPYETIRNVYEYVEQRQRLLNRNSVPRAFRHRKWTASSRRTAIFIWRSKTVPKSTHDLLRLTSQCSSIREPQKPRLPRRSDPSCSFARTWLNELKVRNIRVNVLSPGAGRHTGFPATRQGDELVVRIPDPAGNDGSSRGNRDGRAVSCFRRFELREWAGVVRRRRLLGHLNSRRIAGININTIGEIS